MKSFTYKKAGVDIEKARLFKEKIFSLAKQTFSGSTLKSIGGFGALFEFPEKKYKEPILVSSADGVGTKLKIAQLVNRHNTVGIDLVAMNANDILCAGAEPLFFLDYIAYNRLSEKVLKEIIRGIVDGCKEAGCALIGGETAQMPNIYKEGDYDLAGFCVGVVDKNKLIDGSKIKIKDLVIGLESGGLHSNGFSLVRKVFSKNELVKKSKELLKPTRIYVKAILSLLSDNFYFNNIHGIAHITGGAFYDKIARILPSNLKIKIDRTSWKVPKIFLEIKEKGNINDREMYRVFNMGIGMILVVENTKAEKIIFKLKENNFDSWIIGEVVKGKKEVEIL